MTAVGTRTRAVLAAGIVALAGVGAAGGAAPDAQYTTQIESRALHAFDRATPQVRGLQVSYRVDAHILLPLGFTSVELWNKAGVGSAVASYRDCELQPGEVVRAFELFSSSDPPKAHGFDRRGFFREAVRVAPSGVMWTAYFGAMTSWPEQTLSEARKAANGPQPHTYEAIDGIASPTEARAAVFTVSTHGKLTDSAALWSAVRPQLDGQRPRDTKAAEASAGRTLPPLAFLGALQVSLRSAAVHRARPVLSSASRVAFTHYGLVRQLELAAMTPDPGRGRKAVAAGLARRADDVYELRYRILNPGFENGEFRLWAELPAGTTDDALTPPLPPLGWELQLRSYLKLVFERVS